MTPHIKRSKGNPWFAIQYAFISLKKCPIRNLGITIILAVGISLPTTVFVWTSTGAKVALSEFITYDIYHLGLIPASDQSIDTSNIFQAAKRLDKNVFIEKVHQIPSTIGILSGMNISGWDMYGPYMTDELLNAVYQLGIKDTEVFTVTKDMLNLWSHEFTYRGNFSLSTNQILVSENFTEYTRDVHGVNIDVGSIINLDLVHAFQLGNLNQIGTAETLRVHHIENLTVVGVYWHNASHSLLANSFPTISRINWNYLDERPELVFGLLDSVIILQEQIGNEAVALIESNGFFAPAFLAQASESSLAKAGPYNAAENLIILKTRLQEEYPRIRIIGLLNLWRLENNLRILSQSQILVILVFPILIMSLILTIFTSETSISYRKNEIRTLRAKGASFNQILSTCIWESILLSSVSFFTGIGLALVIAPVMGASTGSFNVNFEVFSKYVIYLDMPFFALIIAGAIALYLPAVYMVHVGRLVDVTEVDRPSLKIPNETVTDENVRIYALGLGITLIMFFLMPSLIVPIGNIAIGETLVATLMLFLSSYLGAKMMILITAKLSSKASFFIGEKSLYLSQSLKRRKTQFTPLLVILTLTLTSTTMMMIQSNTFEASIENELNYSIGCDIRIEVENKPISFENLLQNLPGVLHVTPIIETWGQVGSSIFLVSGIEPLSYLEIGYFSTNSFASDNEQVILTSLANTQNGIIIPEFHAKLWNRTVGDRISITYETIEGSNSIDMTIVGTMYSAPGFGPAYSGSLAGDTVSIQLGFEAGQEAFVLMDLMTLSSISRINTSNHFLIDIEEDVNTDIVIESIKEERHIHIYTLDSFDLTSVSLSTRLFLSGIQGITHIGFLFCVAMGLSAIVLFLGSAVSERQNEYAIIRSLGGTKKQVTSIILSEFAGVITASIIISLILGVIFGYNMSILTIHISPFVPILPVKPEFPINSILLILTAESFAMLASCYIPARKANSFDPARILRNL